MPALFLKVDIMKKIKIICSDLDGTLLNDDKKLSNKNIQAIKEWQSDGNYFGVTTGRSEQGIEWALDKNFQPDFSVCLNGARVHKFAGSISTHTIPSIDVVRVIKIMKSFSIARISLTKMRVSHWHSHLSLNELNQTGIEKISVQIKDNKQLKEMLKLLKKLPLTTTWSDVDYIEVSASGVSKLSGLKEALLTETSLNQVAAIGDYENDSEIVSNVGIGFAVDNALSELKEAAQVIVNDNNNDAIADMISYLKN